MIPAASVAVDVGADMVAIATKAGNPSPSARRYADGRLYVVGVPQAALERALAEVLGLPIPGPVPASVSNLQARAAMRLAGLFEVVEAALQQHAATLPPVEAAILLDAWERGAFERASPTIALIAELVPLSAQQLDDLFRAAGAVAL
ncbi:hypothetical protein [Teichococcus aestuarii]|uniref:hypothetical protein n=1 Tax=Teichococcus aestuarii TaxID=568898 RepID=UPI0036103F23